MDELSEEFSIEVVSGGRAIVVGSPGFEKEAFVPKILKGRITLSNIVIKRRCCKKKSLKRSAHFKEEYKRRSSKKKRNAHAKKRNGTETHRTEEQQPHLANDHNMVDPDGSQPFTQKLESDVAIPLSPSTNCTFNLQQQIVNRMVITANNTRYVNDGNKSHNLVPLTTSTPGASPLIDTTSLGDNFYVIFGRLVVGIRPQSTSISIFAVSPETLSIGDNVFVISDCEVVAGNTQATFNSEPSLLPELPSFGENIYPVGGGLVADSYKSIVDIACDMTSNFSTGTNKPENQQGMESLQQQCQQLQQQMSSNQPTSSMLLQPSRLCNSSQVWSS